MKRKTKIIITVAVILTAVLAFFGFNYLKTRMLWKNTFDLKYEGTNKSKAFIGGEYTLLNKTSNTYSIDYIYVHAEPIIERGKTVKIKTYKTIYPNSSVDIQILKSDLLEAFGLEDVPIWGEIIIEGFEYNKK